MNDSKYKTFIASKCAKIFAVVMALAVGGAPCELLADHDTVAQGVFNRLPEKWKCRMKKGEMWRRFLETSHFPDNGRPELIPECDRDWLKQHKAERPFDYHWAPQWLLEFDRLVRAIERDDADAYFFYVAALSHGICDANSCNHDHLLHLLYCGWSAREFCPRLELDCGWVESRQDTKKMFFDSVAALDGLDAWTGLSRDEVFRALYRLQWEGCEQCAAQAPRLAQAAIDWALEKTDANAARLGKELTESGIWAVKHTLLICAAAEQLAASGTYREPDFKAIRKAGDVTDGKVWAERPVSADAYAREFDEDPSHPAKVRVLYDASAYFAAGVFSNVQVPLPCQIVGSLRKLRPDLPVSLMSVREAAKAFPDPAKVPLVIVPARGLVGFMGFDSVAFMKAAKAYAEKGGKLIWIDGSRIPDVPAANSLAKVICQRNEPEHPGRSVWPEPLPVLMKSAFRWKAGDRPAEWKYHREPKYPVGWMWSPSPFWFDSEKFPVDAIRLAELVTPADIAKESTVKVIAAAAPAKNPTFAYVANNLLFPYMLTDEKPQIQPLTLRLDSVGERVFGDVLKLLDIR